jgi:hypothetical protein
MTGGILIAEKTRVSAHRPLWQTWPINDPDANFLSPRLRILTNKEKDPKTKKVRKGRPVETAAAVEIDSGGLRQPFLDDFHQCLKKPTHKTASAFSQLRTGPTAINEKHGEEKQKGTGNRQQCTKCDSCLTEVIHFGNDVHSSVASLRPLDAFPRNRWRLSVGITGGVPRNTQLGEISFCAYNSGNWRKIVEHMNRTASLSEWIRAHGRHKIYANGQPVQVETIMEKNQIEPIILN